MTLLLDLIYALLVGLGWPLLVWRRLRRGPGSLAIGERLGRVPSRPVSARCVWIHGVSLGEINATRTIIAELRRRLPDTVVVVSATTQTGLARARELYPKLTVFRFPLDFSFIIRRVLDRVRPSAIVLMELEAWPNLVAVASARDVPVLIANGRITGQRSVGNFQRPLIRWFARRMFAQLDWIGAQDEVYARRFVEVGARPERVHVVGSVKYDAADLADRIDGQAEVAESLTIDGQRPLWVCGSTGPDEEAALLDAYRRLLADFPDLQLALVPRKPERFDEVARLVSERGFACLRRSGKPPLVPRDVPAPRPVFLGDTLGELRKFYALADVVFVGRTLVPMGGSDVMEVAGLARPVLVGPHCDNFAEAVTLLVDGGGGLQVADVDGLVAAVGRLLRDPSGRRVMGAAARRVIESRRGATERTVDAIIRHME